MNGEPDLEQVAQQLHWNLQAGFDGLDPAPLAQKLGPAAERFEPLMIARLRELLRYPFEPGDPYDCNRSLYSSWTVCGSLIRSIQAIGPLAVDRAVAALTEDLEQASYVQIRKEIARTIDWIRRVD